MNAENIDRETLKSVIQELLVEERDLFKDIIKEILVENQVIVSEIQRERRQRITALIESDFEQYDEVFKALAQ